MSTAKYYTIKITGATSSPGPYRIYLNSVFGTIATRYPELTPATDFFTIRIVETIYHYHHR